MEILKKFDLPNLLIQNNYFLESLYIFIQESNLNLTVEENMEKLFAKYSENLNEAQDLSLGSMAVLDRQVDFLNIAFNKRKCLTLLSDHLPLCKVLLNESLTNHSFCEELKLELEDTLFGKPSFTSLCFDTFFRMNRWKLL